MMGSRMTAAGVVFLLVVASWLLGMELLGPLVKFLTPAGSTPVFTGMTEHARPLAYFPAVGASIGLGSLVWLRFALRGPYIRVMAMLLGLAGVSGFLMALFHRCRIEAEYSAAGQLAGSLIQPVFDAAALNSAAIQVTLVAAGSTLLTAVVMSLIKRLQPKATAAQG